MSTADSTGIDDAGFAFSAVGFPMRVTDENIIKHPKIHQAGELSGIFLVNGRDRFAVKYSFDPLIGT